MRQLTTGERHNIVCWGMLNDAEWKEAVPMSIHDEQPLVAQLCTVCMATQQVCVLQDFYAEYIQQQARRAAARAAAGL